MVCCTHTTEMAANKTCCVTGCKALTTEGTSLTLHGFPNPQKEFGRFTEWVAAVGCELVGLSNEYIYKSRRVCHSHFELKFCCRYNRLSRIAVPTINLPGQVQSIPKSSVIVPQKRKTQNSPCLSPSTSSHELFAPLAKAINITEDNCSSAEVNPIQDVSSPSKELILQVDSAKSSEILEYEIVFDDDGSTIINSEPIPEALSNKKVELNTGNDNFNRRDEPLVPVLNYWQLIPPLPPRENITFTSSLETVAEKDASVASKAIKKAPATPTVQELKMKLRKSQYKLSKCRKKIRDQAAKIKASSYNKLLANPTFIKALENFPSATRTLILIQFREHKKKKKGRRFTAKEKMLALSIFRQSPEAYKVLRRLFILPATNSLFKLMEKILLTEDTLNVRLPILQI